MHVDVLSCGLWGFTYIETSSSRINDIIPLETQSRCCLLTYFDNVTSIMDSNTSSHIFHTFIGPLLRSRFMVVSWWSSFIHTNMDFIFFAQGYDEIWLLHSAYDNWCRESLYVVWWITMRIVIKQQAMADVCLWFNVYSSELHLSNLFHIMNPMFRNSTKVWVHPSVDAME